MDIVTWNVAYLSQRPAALVSRNPLANGLLSILSWVICTHRHTHISVYLIRERERENNNYTHAATHSNVILRPTKPIHHALGIIRQSLLCIYSVNIWWNVDSGGEDRELPSHQPKVCGTPQIPMDTGALPLPPEGVPALLTPTFISLIDVWKWYKIPLMFEKMPREILIRCERNVGHGAWPGCCTVSS